MNFSKTKVHGSVADKKLALLTYKPLTIAYAFANVKVIKYKEQNQKFSSKK